MKKLQIIGRILAWFNLIIWGIPLVSSLLGMLAAFNSSMLVRLVLFAAIPLQSYAALQLQKSLRHPELKLSQQTPAGIRFVGIIALFIGILVVLAGVLLLQDAKDVLPGLKDQMAGYNMGDTSALTVDNLKAMGGLMLFLGLTVIASVMIHLRLLRWYYLVKQSDVS